MDEPRDQILTACRALFLPDQVTELRILGIGGREKHKAAGWFNDMEALATAALAYEARSPLGLYVTLNPLHAACLARTNNKIKDAPETTTTERDVLRRHWLPIDIDPTRPAGVSSTDAELEASRALAARIAGWLESELHFPPGLRAHSGNGVHLLYRIDLPNDKAAGELVTACLAALSERYDGDGPKVDPAVANAARIWKLYGTVGRKGEHTPDRPHRRSRLWLTAGRYPAFAELGVVTNEQLATLAALRRSPTPPASAAGGGRKASKKRHSAKGSTATVAGVDLPAFIREHGITVASEEAWDGGWRYVLAACLFDSSHVNGSAALGRTADGSVFYKCMHDSCAAKQWADVKALLGAVEKKDQPAADKELSGNPWELARTMLGEDWLDPDTGQVLMRRHREAFYRYDSRRRAYKAQADDTVRVGVTRWLGDRVEKTTHTLVRDVLDCAGAMVTVSDEIEIPFISRVDTESGCTTADPRRYNRVPLRNGILDVDRIMAGESVEACLTPHTPEWFDVSALPFKFPTNADQLETPVWNRFLADTFQGDEDRMNILQEAFGYCFFQDSSLETFFVFHGRGRNGKSTVLSVLRTMLGENNVCSLSPEQLADRFLIGQLYGRYANLCADMNEMDSVQEGILRAAVTGDLVTCDRKYRDPLQFRSRAKMFFATNVLPRFTDTSLGTWRRMVLIPFEYVCPLDKIDVRLFSKLEAEMPGIFIWALQGTQRLKEAQRFTASESCRSAARDYRLACFPILMFLEE